MIKRHLRTLLAPAVIGFFLTIAAVPSTSAQDGWEFDLAIYAWLPTIEGKLAYDLPGLGDTIEIDPADLIENLEFTAMVAFAARRDRWSILGDVIYLKEAASRNRQLDIGDGINLRADFELQSWVTNFAGAYDVARSERSTHGILVGVRYFSMDTRLSISSDRLDITAPLEESSSLWNGVVGVQGRLGLAERWFVPYHLDIGTGDSDLTWQAMAGVGYNFKWAAWSWPTATSTSTREVKEPFRACAWPAVSLGSFSGFDGFQGEL